MEILLFFFAGQPRDASELLNRLLRHEISVEEFFSEADKLPDEDLKALWALLKDRVEEINRTFR
jgi:hypothetical protein